MQHIHLIWPAGIGISALGRYFMAKGATVSGSEKQEDEMVQSLRSDGLSICIGDRIEDLPPDTTLVIASEAWFMIDEHGNKLSKSRQWDYAVEKGIRALTYPEAMAEIFNASEGIAVAGTHGKSTTTAMLGVAMREASTIVGTKVPQFDGKNVHIGTSNHFVLETCEYRKALLNYHPKIAIITNIDFDHPDSYKDLDDYRNVFQRFIAQVSDWVILSADDTESKKLDLSGKNVAWVSTTKKRWWKSLKGVQNWEELLPELSLQVPWDHLLTDAYLAFVAAKLTGMEDAVIIERLNSYRGAWRRSEFIRETVNDNLIFSDYGHHPSEIRPTLKAFKEKYPDRQIVVTFQPHQYARTIGLLEDFKTAFDDADTLIIPNIYFSRDTIEDVEAMPASRFVSELQQHYPQTIYGETLENTAEIIKQLDTKNPRKLLILILGAGDIDDLRGLF